MRFWSIMLCLWLSGCAALPGGRSPAAPPPQPDLGELQLHRTLTVPAHQGWIYFQGGQVFEHRGYLSLQAVDQYYPNCRLELRAAADRAVSIEPDRFRIVRIRHDQEFVERTNRMFASLRPRLASAAGPVVTRTVFDLRSARQPQVRRLRCAQWEDPWDARYPSLRQVQNALGDIFTLQPP